ncbi:MAG: hypothetical protein IT318_27290 [Anaerolineales bacterium]|nr:hypothetical protein [Anaerolineales bacterium]
MTTPRSLVFSLMLVLSMIVSACGSGATSVPPTVAATQAPADVPTQPAATEVEGGAAVTEPATQAPAPTEAPTVSGPAQTELIVALGTEISTLDFQRTSGEGLMVGRHLSNHLVFPDENGEIQPDLAERWEIGDDGMTYTFFLRQGVTFHDGTPWNAEALRWNLERALGPDSPPSLAKTWMGAIDYSSVRVIDEYTVELKTFEPFGGFLYSISNIGGGLMMSPASVDQWGDDVGTHPVGTGPYRLLEWIRGERLVLERNPDYWGEPPAFEKITFLPIPEATTRVLMLETGEVDVAVRIPTVEVERLSANPEINIIGVTVIRPYSIMLNTSQPPFDDVRVRQAANYAVDKQAIVDSLFLGQAEILNSPLPPGVPGYSPVGEYPYDLKLAKQLLAEAGYENGADIVIDCPQGRLVLDTEVCSAVGAMLTNAGLRTQTRIFGDYAQFLDSRTADTAAYNGTFFGWATGSLDPDGAFFPTLYSQNVGKRWNFSQYANPTADEQIMRGHSSLDWEDRAEAYLELQKFLWEDAPWLYLYSAKGFTGVRAGIEGVFVRPDEQILLYSARQTAP